MFFAGLIIFLVCTLYLPWFSVMIVAFAMGAYFKSTLKQHLHLACAAGIAHSACAFMANGRNYGLISKRMGGLFSLPTPGLIFVVLFMISFLSAFLWLRGGVAVRQALLRRS